MRTTFGWIDAVSYGAYVAFVVFALATGAHTVFWFAGLALSVICATLWVVARWQLGAAFSVGAEAHQLVTGGLYSKVRHPIYVFGTMAFMFVVLALLGLPALVVWAIVIPIQVIRAGREGRVLAQAFGPKYEAYRKSTWL